MKLKSFLTLIVLLAGCSSAREDKRIEVKGARLISETFESTENSDQFSMNVAKYELDNGLNVLLIQNARLPLFSLHLFYGVGSKHELKGMTGSSHFLEHMMFKGAKKFGQGAFDKIIEGNGGVSNAYTNYDMTVYYETMPIDALELILDVEADRMENLTLEEKGFLSEKEVVLEERKMRYENSPRGQLYIRTFTQMFAGTPYETPVIGTVEDIKSVTRKQVYDYFKTYYAPNNATLVIAGDIDFEATIKSIVKYFGAIAPSELLAQVKQEREDEKLYQYNGPHQYEEHLFGQSENPIFMLAFPSYPYGHRMSYVGDLLASILAGQGSSFLQQKYVKSQNPVLSSIYAGNYNLQHSGILYITGEMMPSVSPADFNKRLQADLRSFCADEINERSVFKVRNKILKSFYNELETSKGIADYLGSLDVLTGDFQNYLKELEVYNSIEVEELQKSCVELLVKPRPYYLTIWNQNKIKAEI